VSLNSHSLDAQTLQTTMSVLLKHESDLQRVKRELERPADKPRRMDDDADQYPYRRRN
jgi:hypothetical protein